MMKANLPNSAIKVAAMNDNVVLTGTVASALESTRAADLAASFTGDPKKVVNMLSVAGGEQVMLKVRISEMQRQIAKQFGVNLSGVAMIGGTPLALSTSNPVRPSGQRAQRSVGRRRSARPARSVRCRRFAGSLQLPEQCAGRPSRRWRRSACCTPWPSPI